MTDVAVRVEGLQVRYVDGRIVTIRGMPFVVERGERVALLGPNGSGKSTLLRAILGLIKRTSGDARVLGADPGREFDRIRPHVGALLQDVEAQLLAPTVGEDLAFGLAGRGLTPDEVQRRVEEIARWFDLLPLLDKVPHYLSGGERRKVALAGALVTEPDLLVLDEPFAGLDPRSRRELSGLIRDGHARRHNTLLLTTHEVQELPDLVDTLYVLSEDGELAARGTPSEVFAQHELLLRCNLEPPPLVRLLAALEQRGEHLPVSNDPEAVADALLAWRNRKVESRPVFPVPNIGRGSERDPG